MSILIKGMTMPETCLDCPLHCSVPFEDRDDSRRAISCPLVEIPAPHGELIDRSKIGLTNFERFMFAGDFRESFLAYIDKVECAPTIIEAEGAADES